MGKIIGSDMKTTRDAEGSIEIDKGAEICLGEGIAAAEPRSDCSDRLRMFSCYRIK